MTAQDIKPETITFQASDGHQLTADVYRGASPRVGIMISAGTGFPRRFYRHIAAHLASLGAIVLTYDYRGIGDSGGGNLAGSDIEYTDWGRYDMAAALDTLANHCLDNIPLTHVAHSVGGHFVGLMPNHNRLARNAFVSVGSGYIWHHQKRQIPISGFFWWLAGPLQLAMRGYIKSGLLWPGESLPPKVFRTWRRWCQKPRYFETEMDTTLSPQYFDQVTSPIRCWIPVDDPIATPRTAQVILDFYKNSETQITTIKPADFGRKKIDHQGAFTKGMQPLWDDIYGWLTAN